MNWALKYGLDFDKVIIPLNYHFLFSIRLTQQIELQQRGMLNFSLTLSLQILETRGEKPTQVLVSVFSHSISPSKNLSSPKRNKFFITLDKGYSEESKLLHL